MTARTLVFLDTETTGLDPRTHRVWDLGYIRRTTDGADTDRQTFISAEDIDLDQADPFALNLGRYWERHPNPRADEGPMNLEWMVRPERAVARQVARDLHEAIVVGAVPWFDTAMLTAMLHRNWLLPTWHYHLVDVETLAAGQLGMRPPWNFDQLLAEFGLTYEEADRHTALGDARMAARLYDKVLMDGAYS